MGFNKLNFNFSPQREVSNNTTEEEYTNQSTSYAGYLHQTPSNNSSDVRGYQPVGHANTSFDFKLSRPAPPPRYSATVASTPTSQHMSSPQFPPSPHLGTIQDQSFGSIKNSQQIHGSEFLPQRRQIANSNSYQHNYGNLPNAVPFKQTNLQYNTTENHNLENSRNGQEYSHQNYSFDPNAADYSNVDHESSYIDHTQDNIDLNTYVDEAGAMVNPYHDEAHYSRYGLESNPYAKKDFFDEENDLSTSIINSYISKDADGFKFYDDFDEKSGDADTLHKLGITTSNKSILESTSTVNTMVSNKNLNRANAGISRKSTVLRKFKLWNGNFVFDSPISSSLLMQYSNAATQHEDLLSNEFKFMRYQAITCEPDQLMKNQFTIRQLNYMVPRQTEMMIVVTMYNEDHILLGRTLKGVMNNVRTMVRKKNSNTWGPDAWKKIVVCVVSDGRAKINDKALSLLSALGCYQGGFAKDQINDKMVNMHVYEHTTMMNITEVTEDDIKLECDQSTVPIQMLFCLKEQNKKKINSHRWAFEGLAPLLNPNIVALLDAGTMPGNDSIYQLWREFRNPQVGGACGEIKTDIGKFGKNLINPLVASQNFEYKISNILDKTTESNFGFITVLPGAFSAYRYEAVVGQPLEKYFFGEHMEEDQTNLHFFSSNMYLAEDRILCFEIVTKKNSNWILKYCKESYASTDVPEMVPEFILQRRRWLNGSFFASIYSLCHFYRVWTSGHTIGRKFILTIEFIYLLLNTVVAWFAISSFFLVFRILCLSMITINRSVFNILSVVFLWLYGICILSTFILSLGNKPKSTHWFYVITCCFFAVLMAYMIFCSVFLCVRSFENIIESPDITVPGLFTSETFRDIVISIGSTVVLYVLSSVIYLQPWHMITSFAQYILLSPSYINVLNIYAFCNVHDISWGTKGAVSRKSLGKISTKADGTFDMEILISSQEIQNNYDEHLENLTKKPDAATQEQSQNQESFEEKKSGYFSTVRSMLIIVWIMTNFIVVAVVLETGGIAQYIALQKSSEHTENHITVPSLPRQSSYYFNIILWLVALNAMVRFAGCFLYLIIRPFKKLSYNRTARKN